MNISQFIGAYKDMLTNYFNFQGRVSRKSFWYATAVNIAVSIVLSIISGILFLTNRTNVTLLVKNKS